jgi:hypothetical protein
MNRYLKKIILVMLFSVSAVFSQSSEIDYNTLSQHYNITQEKDDILKLECKLTGKTAFRTENIKSIPSDYDFDLVIDLRTTFSIHFSLQKLSKQL